MAEIDKSIPDLNIPRGKILVTGGAGYIGSHTIVALMAHGYIPVVIDNFVNSNPEIIERIEKITQQKTTYYNVDCTNKEDVEDVFIKEKNIIGVIHFAAYKAVGGSVLFPEKYFKNNVGSLNTIIDVMKKFKIQNLVFSSSCTVYGQPDKLPVTEETPLKPAVSPYGSTKQKCEKLLSENADLHSLILRYFNPIGAHHSGIIGETPSEQPSNLVPAILQVVCGKWNKLTINGNCYNTIDGTCVRDYIHVMDLAEAHIKAFDYLISHNDCNFEVFNLGMGRGYSVTEIITLFEKVNNVKIPVIIGPPRDGDVAKIYANVDKAYRELHWRNKHSIEDALRDAYHWQNCLTAEVK